MLTREQIVEALKTVEDPEILMDVWFLGLIYAIDINGGKVKIDMTLTSPMCPMGPEMMQQVKEKVSALEGVEDVEIRLVFSPPWEPSDEVRAALGII